MEAEPGVCSMCLESMAKVVVISVELGIQIFDQGNFDDVMKPQFIVRF